MKRQLASVNQSVQLKAASHVVAYCYQLRCVVWLMFCHDSDSPAKTAGPFEMPFGLDLCGPRGMGSFAGGGLAALF